MLSLRAFLMRFLLRMSRKSFDLRATPLDRMRALGAKMTARAKPQRLARPLAYLPMLRPVGA